jgi:hypothetical protein
MIMLGIENEDDLTDQGDSYAMPLPRCWCHPISVAIAT